MDGRVRVRTYDKQLASAALYARARTGNSVFSISLLDSLASSYTDTYSRLREFPETFVKMGFGDLKKAAGLEALNEYLADRSFIEG